MAPGLDDRGHEISSSMDEGGGELCVLCLVFNSIGTRLPESAPESASPLDASL